ncbi:MAG: helix-turn-helix transcriptional regulator [Gammaproteobacteria bacterium]|nr:helix-turn-helix transcriptional regulator [Gammaproteobacteria bacterium]
MRHSSLEENRDFYTAVGRRVADIRKGRMTQETLAEKLNLTRTSVINIEKGRQQVLLHTLVNIARALQVSPTDLIPGEENIEALLRDKSKKGRDWILKSAVQSK